MRPRLEGRVDDFAVARLPASSDYGHSDRRDPTQRKE
jgi:hypothetical protein